MSDLSLLTGIYANVEVFASLIDAVIERIGARGDSNANEAQQRLGQLLIDAGDQGQSSKSYEALILNIFLRQRTGEPLVNIERLGRRLLAGEADGSDRKQLEVLAEGLERERSEVAVRLRGRR